MILKKLFLALLCSMLVGSHTLFSGEEERAAAQHQPGQPGILGSIFGASLFSAGTATVWLFGLRRFAPQILETHGDTKVVAGLGFLSIFGAAYLTARSQRESYRNYSEARAEQEATRRTAALLGRVTSLETTITRQAQTLSHTDERVTALDERYSALRTDFDTRVGVVDTQLATLTRRQDDRDDRSRAGGVILKATNRGLGLAGLASLSADGSQACGFPKAVDN